MLKVLQALVLSSLSIGSARAGDVSLVVDKIYHREFQVGGMLSYFRKDKGTEEYWIEMHPMSGTVVVQSVSLDPGSCRFDNVVLPATVSFDGKLEVRPNCNFTKAEILTDKGLYRFTFEKSAE